jgi:hypothetical protein
VSVSSLARYRRSLVSFVRTLPMWLERAGEDGATGAAPEGDVTVAEEGRGGLTAIDGGRA